MIPMLKGIVLALAAGASAQLSGCSWGEDHADIFGTYKGYLFHMYLDKGSWGKQLELLAGNSSVQATGTPTAISYGVERVHVFYTGLSDSKVYSREWDGYEWLPDPKESFGNDIGGPVVGKVSATSTRFGQITLIALSPEGEVLYRQLNGIKWEPDEGWESLGGSLIDSPASVRTGEDLEMLHIIGVSKDKRELVHMYKNESDGESDWSKWESLSRGPFAGPVSVTKIWNSTSFDVFAVHDEGLLYHTYWDGNSTWGWGNLGRSSAGFVGIPAVKSSEPRSVDIVAAYRNLANDLLYAAKSFDGEWVPGKTKWWDDNDQTFAGAPEVMSWLGSTEAYFGITTEGKLVVRYWWFRQWVPKNGSWLILSDLAAVIGASGDPGAETDADDVLRLQEELR